MHLYHEPLRLLRLPHHLFIRKFLLQICTEAARAHVRVTAVAKNATFLLL